MKKKTLLVLLIVAMVGMVIAVANGVYILDDKIKRLQWWEEIGAFTGTLILSIRWMTASLVIYFLALVAIVVIFICLVKQEKLIPNAEDKQEIYKQRVERKKEKMRKRISQLNAKLNKLKNEDDH